MDIIVLNPTSDTALNAVIKEATDKGITVVAVDQAVTGQSAYVLSNDQENYGYLGAKWLFEKLGGTGKVVYMRGIDGVPADSARDTGFQRALAENPGIEIVKELHGLGSDGRRAADPGHLLVGHRVRRDLDVGHRHPDRRGVQVRRSRVRADRRRGQQQVRVVPRTDEPTASIGAAVTNPPPVGGAGLNLGLKVKAGTQTDRVVTLTPEVWDNTTDDGKAKIKAAVDPELNDYYGVLKSPRGRPTPRPTSSPAGRRRPDPGPRNHQPWGGQRPPHGRKHGRE